MSFVKDLLVVLSSYHEGYSLMRRRMRGYPDKGIPKHIIEAPQASVRVVLSRLKKRGLVKNDRGRWRITEEGMQYLKSKLPYRKHGNVDGSDRKPKNMILAFDIPERRRRARDWLRAQLGNLGFEMLQKSVWFGPAPLPKDFVASLGELGILKFVKFFRAEERDVVHGS